MPAAALLPARARRGACPIPITTDKVAGAAPGELVSFVHRLLPERPFPPYAYVPGRFPHPVRDPQGHSFQPKAIDPSAPPEAEPEAFLWGIAAKAERAVLSPARSAEQMIAFDFALGCAAQAGADPR